MILTLVNGTKLVNFCLKNESKQADYYQEHLFKTDDCSPYK